MSAKQTRTLPRIPRTLQVEKVWIETNWKPGDDWLSAKARCPECNDVMIDLSTAVEEISDTYVWLKEDRLSIHKQCRCGMHHSGMITADPGYPPKDGLSGWWGCSGCVQSGRPTYFGSIIARKGRIYLRCCGKDWTFRACDVVRAITGRRIAALPF